MTSTEIGQFANELEAHLTAHLLPFWCGPALDEEQGGWMGWLSNDLTPDRSQPKGLIVNSRILWTFSAAYRAHPQTPYREMAQRAYEIVSQRFWDTEHGGAFWRLNDGWKVVDDSKKTYGQAFFMYALSEYHRAVGDPAALRLARDVLDLMQTHAHDPVHGGYIEVCNRDWSEAGPGARLSERDPSEKKSMNTQLHVLEALTNLHRIRPDSIVTGQLRELIGIFQERILDPQTHHLHHFFDEQWRVRSDSHTFGHDIEASWLLCEAAEEMGSEMPLPTVRQTALQMADAVRSGGLDGDGGLFYEGKADRIIDRGKEGWPQAEGVVGFVNAWQISGNPEYLRTAQQLWDYIQRHLIDRRHGDWFWRITPEGSPDSTLPKVSEWKGPYHASRMCLEAAQRLRHPKDNPRSPGSNQETSLPS